MPNRGTRDNAPNHTPKANQGPRNTGCSGSSDRNGDLFHAGARSGAFTKYNEMIVITGSNTFATTQKAIPKAGVSNSPGIGFPTRKALPTKPTINKIFMIF